MATCLAGPLTLGAQSARDLSNSLDSTLALMARSRKELVEYDKAHPPKPLPWSDTMVVGGGRITIYSYPDVRAIAHAAAARADSILTQLGAATATFPAQVYSIARDTSFYASSERPIIVGYRPPGGGSISAATPAETRPIVRTILDQVVFNTMERSKPPLAKWRRGSIPMDSADLTPGPTWGAVRLDLVSSESRFGSACYHGDIDACALYLGVRPVDDPVMTWYDSAGRARTARANRDLANRFDKDMAARCYAGSDHDCAGILRLMDKAGEAPGNDSSRAALIHEAIALGGAGAAGRLLASTGRPDEAIAAAAKVPVDSVVRVWQHKAREAEVKSGDLSVHIVLVGVVWIVLLLVATLRSSRWP